MIKKQDPKSDSVGLLYLQAARPQIESITDQKYLKKKIPESPQTQIHSTCIVLSFINYLEVISSDWEDVSEIMQILCVQILFKYYYACIMTFYLKDLSNHTFW